MSRLTFHFGCAALVAGLVLTSSLSAQGRRPGGGGFGGRGGMNNPLMLVASEAVQKEIGVTDDQKAKLAALREEFQTESEKVRNDAGLTGGGGFQNLTDEQRTKLQEGMKKLTDTFTPKLKETLKPEQLERVQQIGYQVAGPAAYSDPEVVKALDITKEQQEKLAAVRDEFQKKQQELFAGGGEGVREGMTKLRDEQNAEIAKVLTKEQTEKFTTLKGKAFDTSALFGGGRGQGGGKGRPGGDKKKAD